jgi:hypothetical protein
MEGAMRDRYYRLKSLSDLPHKAALVHVYRRLGQALARLDGDDEADEAQPDLILFRAALERLRQDLVGTFVLLEDDALWQAHWGDLVEYRGGRKSEGPAPRETPALKAEPDLDAWDYTLNLNSITSPSLTT